MGSEISIDTIPVAMMAAGLVLMWIGSVMKRGKR
jgi:hypothetical protein